MNPQFPEWRRRALAPETALPATLGRYSILGPLGAGGMADVLLGCIHGPCGFERLTALKIIRPSHATDPEFVRMFIDEARIAMRLGHSGIVQTLELGQADGRLFLALEYVDGLDLAELLARAWTRHGRLPVPVALFIVEELARALHFAHTAAGPDGRPLGIVHRDVSPPNVMVTFAGEVKLSDFGLARATDRLCTTQPGLLKGKIAYAAPELFRSAVAGPEADLWSLGVVLYELLTGQPPYPARDVLEVLAGLDTGLVIEPPSNLAPIDPIIDSLVLALLTIDPRQRLGSALELLDVLTDYAEHLGLTGSAARRQVGNWVRALVPERGLRPEPIAPPSQRRSLLPGARTSLMPGAPNGSAPRFTLEPPLAAPRFTVASPTSARPTVSPPSPVSSRPTLAPRGPLVTPSRPSVAAVSVDVVFEPPTTLDLESDDIVRTPANATTAPPPPPR